ncbi:MAG TPA: hypothetical protein VMI33_12585 [Streptosporangiaceae bacterium]|nr:hypothetical protein [Streptosporangiaceae bacterium]
MISRQRARVAVVGAGLAVATAGSALAALSPAQAATPPGWRLVSTIHQGAAAGINGLSSVISPARGDSWAFGGSDVSGATPGTPIAEHWGGLRWRAAALPGGLTGVLGASSAAGPSDIWVVSQRSGYVLHYNGVKWSVAKQFKENQGLPLELTGVIAFSPANVWVFGGPGAYPGLGTWHLHGRTWTKVTGVGGAIGTASAVSASNIWAIGANASAPADIIVRYNGRTWQQQKSAALANVTFSGILAQSATSVWVTGSSYTDNHNVPRLLHYNGKTWTRVAVPWPVPLGAPVPDGGGGIWAPSAGTDPSDWYALHRSGTGVWRHYLVTKTGQAYALGLIWRSASLWDVGLSSNLAGGSAAVWGYGPRA